MNERLRILHVEDDCLDAELVQSTLLAEGVICEHTRVDTREAFVEALERGGVDLILADYSLPQFDGITAQTLAQTLAPDLPFIFVSGTCGEEVAIERIKSGATDYVLKDRLSRLAGVVRRALSEARERGERRRAEAEIRTLNAELEQRVTDRTAQLAEANGELRDRGRELHEAKAFLEHLIAASPSMIFRMDADTLSPTYVSPNIGWLLGYAPEEMLGVAGFWMNIVHPEDRSRVVAGLGAALDGSVAQLEQEYRCLCKDGHYRWFFTLTRIEHDDEMHPVGVLGYALDIADRKKMEEDIREARLEAERANTAKSEFLSYMSHDLRTPLNAILGFAQLLEAEVPTADQRESVQQILKGGDHLLGLINDVLDIARIESGHLALSPEPVAIDDIVSHAVELIRPLATRRHIGLSVEFRPSDRHVIADRQRLAQVLLNLLSNAVKYNCDGGRVAVSCADLGGRLQIRVSDTGKGIAPEKAGLLFKPFERLGADGTAIEGTGLGLALSKGLAEAMGGSLGFNSEADRGCTFWVELAVASAPRDESSAAGASDREAAPRAVGTVLYIEDNQSNTRLMERVLTRRPGIELRTAHDGATGLASAGAQSPGLILLDLHLPDIAGEEVLRRLRSDPATRGIPVVILTADASPSQSLRLREAGATAYLTKPLNVAQVLDVVDELLAEGVA